MDEVKDVEAFLADIPQLHSWDGGVTWNTGGFTRHELSAMIDTIGRELGAGAHVAETGAGSSTVAMMLASAASVVSIAPDKDLFDRITEAGRRFGCDSSVLRPYIAFSEDVLPQLVQDIESSGRLLDFALIDGGHGWPTVFVDFCYLNRALRQDGFLMVDDIQIHAVKELARMLMEDRNFVLVKKFRKTLLFRKRTAIRYLPDFGAQPYIRRRTKEDRDAEKAFEL